MFLHIYVKGWTLKPDYVSTDEHILISHMLTFILHVVPPRTCPWDKTVCEFIPLSSHAWYWRNSLKGTRDRPSSCTLFRFLKLFFQTLQSFFLMSFTNQIVKYLYYWLCVDHGIREMLFFFNKRILYSVLHVYTYRIAGWNKTTHVFMCYIWHTRSGKLLQRLPLSWQGFGSSPDSSDRQQTLTSEKLKISRWIGRGILGGADRARTNEGREGTRRGCRGGDRDPPR